MASLQGAHATAATASTAVIFQPNKNKTLQLIYHSYYYEMQDKLMKYKFSTNVSVHILF
jgi:hypothetical protein